MQSNEKLLALIRPICIGQASSIWNGYTNIEVDTRITTFNTSTMAKVSNSIIKSTVL